MNKPDYLYKYQKLTAHSLASIINGSIWMAKPSTFNDPFDCALTLSPDSFEESMRFVMKELSDRMAERGGPTEALDQINPGNREHFEAFRKSLLNIGENIGVLSLSAVADHMLMWSHYGDQHRGFCIEYDCREGTDLRKLVEPVQYLEEIPRLSVADIRGPDKHRFLQVAIFTKAKHWEYEQEWRVIMDQGNRVYAAPSPITSVIFGARMPIEEKVMVSYALRNRKDISFKEAHLADGRFAIEFRPFSVR